MGSRGKKSDPFKAVEKFEKSTRSFRPVDQDTILSDPKKTRAIQLLQREEEASKKSRLECLLVQQHTAKYGSKNTSSQVNSAIKVLVHDFLAENGGDMIDSIALQELDSNVRDISKRLKTEIVAVKQAAKQTGVVDSKPSSGGCSQKTVQFSKDNNDRQQPAIDPNQWSVLDAILSQADIEKVDKEKRWVLDKRDKLKRELDSQLVQHKDRDRKAEEDRKKEQEDMRMRFEAMNKDAQDKQALVDRKSLVQKGYRLTQIEEKNARLAKEQKEKIAAEQWSMQRSKLLVDEESKEIAACKEKKRIQMEQMKVENERNKALKADAKIKQCEYELKLNKEFEDKVKREDALRLDAFNKRMEKSSRAVAEFDFKAVEDASQLADKRMMNEIQRKHDADAKREFDKQCQKKKELIASTSYNKELIERRQKEKDAEKRLDLQTRQKHIEDYAEMQLETKRKEELKRQKAIEVKARLDEQVASARQQHCRDAALSSTETLLNKSLTQKMEQDVEFKRKVVDKVAPPHVGGSLGFSWG